jgi:hypothetical protein
MLKKIALAGLFAITFAVGMGAAQARTSSVEDPSTPQSLCPCRLCLR